MLALALAWDSIVTVVVGETTVIENVSLRTAPALSKTVTVMVFTPSFRTAVTAGEAEPPLSGTTTGVPPSIDHSIRARLASTSEITAWTAIVSPE